MTDQSNSRTAIVLGASIAGLWAARVLADHFDEVLVLDRLLDPIGRDETVRMAFDDVNQLVKPASSLFVPNIALRVLARG